MSTDSDPIITNKKAPDDLTTVVLDVLSRIQYKFLGMLFLIFLFINSDVFINRVLSKFKGATEYKSPTNWGVILQNMFLVILMIAVDACIGQGVI